MRPCSVERDRIFEKRVCQASMKKRIKRLRTDQRLAQDARQLRQEASSVPPGKKREKLASAGQLAKASAISRRLDEGPSE